MDLSGQVAIITGGNKGIGREIAEAFGKRGAKLVLAARNELDLIETTNEFKDSGYDALPLVVDVTNPDQVKKMVEETINTFHKIDVLVNNAGEPGPTKSAEDVTEEEWMQVINSNLTGSFLCIKHVLPFMKNQQKGRIINLSSISAKRPLVYRVGYSAAKMGVIGMTRTLAAELGPFNITVNAICPGFVKGERMEHVIQNQSLKRQLTEQEIYEKFVSVSPLHKFVDARDIAEMAVFLASDAASSITGQDINVSAGVVMY